TMQLTLNLILFVSMLWMAGIYPAACKTNLVSCRLMAEPQLPGLFMNGDYVIGGIFSIHTTLKFRESVFYSFTFIYFFSIFNSMVFRELRLSRAMEFAIHEINNRTDLLPGITLGYEMHDSCAAVPMAIKVAFQFANGIERFFNDSDSCSKYGAAAVPALVGESGSTPSISMARILGLFGIPQNGLYSVLKRESLCNMRLSDCCPGKTGKILWLDVDWGSAKLERVANVIRRSTARVIVAFLSSGDMRIIMEELVRNPPPPLQWIGSESWITDPEFLKFNMCAGAVGFCVPRAVIPGFREFLLDLTPAKALKSPWLTEFWERTFSCSLKGKTSARECDDIEDISAVQNPHLFNFTHHVIFHQLKRVNFTKNGFPVSFDSKGDPVAVYDWMGGQTDVQYNTLSFLTFTVSPTFFVQVPVSVCSESCPLGTRKAVQKGKPICCYDCIPCAEGEISNTTDSLDCIHCPSEFWPNKRRDSCLPKPVEFLSWDSTLSIILTAFSVAGAIMALSVAGVFYKHRTSPIVRANNSELSFLLLFALALCFLCSLTFIGQPSQWSCMLRHTAFGITFVLCISCVLGKTIVVLMAFRATLPGSNVMKWFGPPQQRLSVLAFTLIQVLNCIIWLTLSPPFPFKNLNHYKERIILECGLGSAVGFWAVLGYIGVLALLCFVLAFLARKLPDNFNEAKFITFSMLIFCAVWITFIPAYVSSPGKFTVAVEIFAILASSFGLIICIFVPKCFIIIFKPEQNTKKHLMAKLPSKFEYAKSFPDDVTCTGRHF
uniref:G-protein coupled receptors family 3 profile domain-containing protein n=1 Tax=Astyanax mexicanus TaxID=7994 RepID=A0A3B1IZY8_ASTMX